MDSSMNNLLKWSIENSAPDNDQPSSTSSAQPSARSISPTALQRLLLNTPSDAELMQAAMTAIRDPDTTLDNKLIAFDNFEQLVENLDNANLLEVLGLWTPLVEELKAEEHERRMMAAWCVGTAVQNNEKSQERLLAVSALPILLRISQQDPEASVRRKAIYALSSAVRNYQPGMDELLRHLPEDMKRANEKVDAGDMDSVDGIMARLKGV